MTTTTATDPSQQTNPDGVAPATNVADTTAVGSTEATTAEGKDGEANTALGDKGPATPETPAAPEAYEAFTVPEGLVLEGERLEQASAFFKEQGWSQEQAQKAVDFYSNLALKDAAAFTGSLDDQVKQAMDSQRAQQTEDWGKQSKEVLGDGYDAAVADARLFVETIADPDLAKAFDELGWGNHPKLIQAFAFAGKLARDSNVHGLGGHTAQPTPKDPASVLFDHPTSKR